MKKLIFTLLILSAFLFSTLIFAQETNQGQTQQQKPEAKPEQKADQVKPLLPKRRLEKPPIAPQLNKDNQPKEEVSGPPPKLEIPEMTFDAGDVVKGVAIEHEFILNNKGTGPLQILRVQPTCGCTVTKYDNPIEAGKSGKIFASVKTEGFSGPISKTINVQTNDAELGTFALTIKANVKTLLSVKPQDRLSLGLVYVGSDIEKEFDITSEDGQPFDVTQITGSDEKIMYNLIPAPDKKSAKFKVTIPADYPVGPIQSNFTLKTTHPKVETLNISLFGTMREPLSVFPQRVTFNGLSLDFIKNNKESAELTKVVTVRFETDASLEVTKVKSTLPYIDVTSEETQPKQAFSIKVHLNPEKVKSGPFEGAIIIITNKKTITVPVKGVIF